MTEIDTEFEENSFDDEYAPEDEASSGVPVDKKLKKKAKSLHRRADVAGPVPGGPGSSNKLASMMQENLGLNAMPEITIPLRSRNICPKPIHPQPAKPPPPKPAPVNPARAAAHADALARLAAAASASRVAADNARTANAAASEALAAANALRTHAPRKSRYSQNLVSSPDGASTSRAFFTSGSTSATASDGASIAKDSNDLFVGMEEEDSGATFKGGAIGGSVVPGSGASNAIEEMDDESTSLINRSTDARSPENALSSALALAQSASEAATTANAMADAADANMAAAYHDLTAASNGLSTSPTASAAMAALGNLTGYSHGSIAMTAADGSYGPRPLKLLTAEILIRQTGRYSLPKLNVPSYLYPVLMTESSRLASEDTIVHLVSTWPFPILNLAELRIPIDGFIQTLPQSVWDEDDDSCLADSFVRGLFYRKRKLCRLQMIVLPKDTSAGLP